MICISVFEILSCEVKSCDLDRGLFYPRECNSLYLARRLSSLMIPGGDSLTLASTLLFEVIVLIADYLASCVVIMKSHSPNLECYCKELREFN